MPTTPQGIDFHEALAILSSRREQSNEDDDNQDTAAAAASNNKNKASCPCQAPHHVEQGSVVKNMGQVIDLGDAEEATSAKTVTREQSTSKQQWLDSLSQMSTRQLLRAVLQAQQQRVATYRDYNQGLQAVLATGNVSYYPTVCTEATAAFGVVSDTLQALRAQLQQRHNTQSYMNMIQTLQKHEQAKLQYTAALHLEQIRLQQTPQDEPDDNATARQLLCQSTSSLQAKVATCVDQINEAIEEIQCAVADAPDDDGNGMSASVTGEAS